MWFSVGGCNVVPSWEVKMWSSEVEMWFSIGGFVVFSWRLCCVQLEVAMWSPVWRLKCGPQRLKCGFQ
jgi:hypothetical protein